MRNSRYFLFALLLLGACKSQESATTRVQTPAAKDALTPSQRADVTYLFFNANKEKILGNYNAAADLFAEVIRKDPGNAAAMYELAGIFIEQKKFGDALFFAKSAYSINPANEWYAQTYAEVLQRNRRFTEAAAVWEQQVKRNPDRSDFYLQWADALIFADKPAEAVKAYDKLEDRTGVNKDISTAKARIYQRMGKNDMAVSELQKLIANDPNDPQAYGMLAEVYQAMGQKEKALETYNRILEIDPDNPFIHLSLADYYRSNGEKEKSVVELKKAFNNPELGIETKISILSSYYALIELHPELREQAMEMTELLVKTHPSDPRAFAVRGDFLIQEKKYEEARVAYRKAQELGSKEFTVISQILFLDSQLQDWDAMIRDSEEAMNLFPDQPLVYFFNGIANSQKKQFAKAVASLNAGVKLVVDNKELESNFYASLGDAYQELKDFTRSDENYDKALDIDPKNANVLNNYAYYLSVRGERLEKAEQMSKLSNELEPNQASYEDTYGWIMFRLGRYNDAKEWIGKSLKNGSDNSATVLEHYGDVLFKLGDSAGALDYWQRAKNAGEGASEFLEKKILERKYVE